MVRPGLALLALILSLVIAPAGGQPTSVLESPAYGMGDFWEYRVEGRLDELLGVENLTGSFTVTGRITARVTALAESAATLNWSGELTAGGQFTLPDSLGGGQASLSGTIQISHAEQRETPYFLPTAFQETVVFDLSITFGIAAVPSLATLELEGSTPPTPEAPTYPVEEGQREFALVTSLESQLTASFLGMEVTNSSTEEISSTLRLDVSPGEAVSLPVGTFSTVRVATEAVTGFVPGPFLGVLPGSKQVADHAPDVGNAVRFQFLQNETEIGNATLLAYSHASVVAPPFWVNPAFLGGLLAVPITILLYRYWRERRRGL